MNLLSKIPNGTTATVVGSILFISCQVLPWKWIADSASTSNDSLLGYLAIHALVSTLLGVWILGSLFSLLVVMCGLGQYQAWREDQFIEQVKKGEVEL